MNDALVPAQTQPPFPAFFTARLPQFLTSRRDFLARHGLDLDGRTESVGCVGEWQRSQAVPLRPVNVRLAVAGAIA